MEWWKQDKVKFVGKAKCCNGIGHLKLGTSGLNSRIPIHNIDFGLS